MEIIGKINVKRDKKVRKKKAWLTIGLVSFAIAMVFELVLGNVIYLVLMVPCTYLLKLRKRMGIDIWYKDVIVFISGNVQERKVEIYNCVYDNNVLYSARYLISSINSISYWGEETKIEIRCVAKKVLFRENVVIPIFTMRPCDIVLYVSLEDAQRIAHEFECALDIK